MGFMARLIRGHKDPRCRFVFGGFVRLHEAAMADPESARLLVNCPSRPWPVSDHGHCDVANCCWCLWHRNLVVC